MDDPYRDPAELHRAGPLLAMLIAAMTLATAPLTQPTTPTDAGALRRPAPAETTMFAFVVDANVEAPARASESETDRPSQS